MLKHLVGKKSNVDKKNWPSKFSFFAYVLLIGNGSNIFPRTLYSFYKYSGGSFTICLIGTALMIAFPIIYMELFLGRYTRRTNVSLYQACPLFISLCIVILIINCILLPTETVRQSFFLSRAVWYIFTPVKGCINSNPECYDYKLLGPIDDNCISVSYGTYCQKLGLIRYPSQYNYWEMDVNPESKIFRQWKIIISLLFTWSIITLCMFLSFRQLAKFVTVCFVLQVIAYLFILLMALFERGSSHAIRQLPSMNFSKTLESEEIMSMIIYSCKKFGLGVPSGYTTLSAHAKFQSKFVQEAMLIIILDLAFTMFLCVATSAVVGVLSSEMKLEYDQIFMNDLGMYLAVFPEFFRYMEVPIVFTIMYFLILGVCELARIALSMYVLFLNIFDLIPAAKKYRTQTVICACSACFVYTLIFTNRFTLNYIIPYMEFVYCHVGLMIFITLQGVMFFYCYGVQRLSDDIFFMTRSRPMHFITAMWITIPIFTMSLLLYGISKRDKIYGDIELDVSQIKLGYIVSIFTYRGMWTILALIPAISTFYLVYSKNLGKPFLSSLKPDFYWGPPSKIRRMARKKFSFAGRICSQNEKRRILLRIKREHIQEDIQMDETDETAQHTAFDVRDFEKHFKELFKTAKKEKIRGRIFSDRRYFNNMEKAACLMVIKLKGDQ